MAEERGNYVYLVEADPKAVTRAVRWRWMLVLSPSAVLLALVAVMALLGGGLPPLWDLLQRLVVLIAILLGIAYFLIRVPCRVRNTDVMIGGDFIHAPLAVSPSYAATVKYQDMTHVKVSTSKGRIRGARIATKGGAVCTGRIKDPGIVVRAVFERAPETVVWRRSWRPFRKLSREQVEELIKKADVPDINSLLPASRDFMQADDLFDQDRQEERIPGIRGWLGRMLGGGTYKTATMTSLETPTPANRYVNLMLVQMFKEGVATRVLRRSEPLPALTAESETIPAPPLEDVLERLKFMCGLDPRARRRPIEGTTHITFEDAATPMGVPYKVSCQFEDKSDTCCQIRLERLAE